MQDSLLLRPDPLYPLGVHHTHGKAYLKEDSRNIVPPVLECVLCGLSVAVQKYWRDEGTLVLSPQFMVIDTAPCSRRYWLLTNAMIDRQQRDHT